jgi:hypothetical protein
VIAYSFVDTSIGLETPLDGANHLLGFINLASLPSSYKIHLDPPINYMLHELKLPWTFLRDDRNAIQISTHA